VKHGRLEKPALAAVLERALRLAHDPAQFPQSFVGGDWADRFRRAARGPSLTSSSMGGKSTETQHRKAVEVPTSVLEKWLSMWAEHWNKQGLYRGGALSVELKERWAGSEDMMLNLFDEAHDKIAEIIFRVDKDREGRKFLAVKDQNTIKKYRSRRLMTGTSTVRRSARYPAARARSTNLRVRSRFCHT
jgi:hypothetical protein